MVTQIYELHKFINYTNSYIIQIYGYTIVSYTNLWIIQINIFYELHMDLKSTNN